MKDKNILSREPVLENETFSCHGENSKDKWRKLKISVYSKNLCHGGKYALEISELDRVAMAGYEQSLCGTLDFLG